MKSIGKKIAIKLSEGSANCSVEIDGVEMVRVLGVKVSHEANGRPLVSISFVPAEVEIKSIGNNIITLHPDGVGVDEYHGAMTALAKRYEGVGYRSCRIDPEKEKLAMKHLERLGLL